MTAIQSPPIRTRTLVDRDPVVDLVRSVSLVIVVLLHAAMTGVHLGADGLVIGNALEAHTGFAVLSWALQVMPLFFAAGGFTALSQWRRMRDRGATPAQFVRSRVERLAVPALAMIGTVVVVLAALTVFGVPVELVHEIGYRIGQPLWFLAVFILASCLVPALAAAHERAPRISLGLLIGAAVVVDVTARSTGVEGLGFLNLAFVWLAVQQLGFFWRDGRIRSGRPALMAAAGGYAAMALLVAVGGYPLDMLVGNNNPPTIALIALGVAHLHLVVAAAPALRRLADRAAVPVTWVGARAMTVYLWHMPVSIVLVAVLLGAGVHLPEPLSADWWAGRGVWLAAVLAVSLLAANRLHVLERLLAPATGRAALLPTATGAVLATAGVTTLLVGGFAGETGVIAVALLGGGLTLARRTAPVLDR